MIMPDDFFDELRDELRAAYNPPPDTPRERLWRELEARRRASSGRPARASAVARQRWLGWALPIAATLLIGIAIGRYAPAASPPDAATRAPSDEPAGAPSGAPARAAASAPATAPGQTAGPRSLPGEAVGAARGAVAGRAADRAAGAGVAAETDPSPAPSPRTVVASGGAPAADRGALPRADGGGVAPGAAGPGAPEAPSEAPWSSPGARDALYRVAALEMLGGAEALLAAVDGIEPSDVDASANLADWSDGMLSQTRLLLDSPAAADPAIRDLLEDLELVLAQLVRLGEGTTAEGDIALVEGTVRERQLLHRIRALLPAGPITRGI